MSSHSDSDSDNDSDFTLMYKAVHFLGKDLDGLIDRYANTYGDKVVRSLGHSHNTVEHTLEHTRIHNNFVDEFESLLEAFAISQCPEMSREEAFQQFFSSMKDTLSGRFQPLCMEDEATPDRIFAESLLAMESYEYFFNVMKHRLHSLTSSMPKSDGGEAKKK